MNKIKGSAFLAYIDFFRHRFGPASIEKIQNALAPEDREALFSKKVLQISWLDYPRHMRFLLTADRVLGKGDGQLVHDGARWTARKDFSGIYKLFVAVASPTFLIRKVPNLWRTFYDSGVVRTEVLTESKVNIVLTDFPGIPEKHELEQLCYFEEIVIMTGAKKARATHPTCMARGDQECLYVVEWG